MNLRWLARVDAEWRRAEALVETLDPATEASLAARWQAVLLQIEYAASCYAVECMPAATLATVEPALLRQASGRRWQEFAAVAEPLLQACAGLRQVASHSKASQPLKNPLFATEESSAAVIARGAGSPEVSVPRLRALLSEINDTIARQRAEAQES